MFEAFLIFLASLGVIQNPDANDEQQAPQETVQTSDQFQNGPQPDSDSDDDSKHSTKEGI